MNLKHEEYQAMQEYKHLYFFDHTWENFRQVRLYSQGDLILKKTDIGEYDGMIFSQKPIKEKKFSITNLEEILKDHNCKLIYFENFEKY